MLRMSNNANPARHMPSPADWNGSRFHDRVPKLSLSPRMGLTPQVNTDVLSWLLRPVPFVAGLPAAAPTPPASFSSTPLQDGGCDPACAVARGDVQDIGPVTKPVEERRPAPFVHGGGATATLAEDLSGQEPGRGGRGDGEQERPSNNRAGFHSYDETHQVGMESCWSLWKAAGFLSIFAAG